jgi:hypothetical protein
MSGMTIRRQADMNVEFEGTIGDLRHCLHELTPRSEPTSGLFQDQPRVAHDAPPVASAATSFFFLRIDSPFISMR